TSTTSGRIQSPSAGGARRRAASTPASTSSALEWIRRNAERAGVGIGPLLCASAVAGAETGGFRRKRGQVRFARNARRRVESGEGIAYCHLWTQGSWHATHKEWVDRIAGQDALAGRRGFRNLRLRGGPLRP